MRGVTWMSLMATHSKIYLKTVLEVALTTQPDSSNKIPTPGAWVLKHSCCLLSERDPLASCSWLWIPQKWYKVVCSVTSGKVGLKSVLGPGDRTQSLPGPSRVHHRTFISSNSQTLRSTTHKTPTPAHRLGRSASLNVPTYHDDDPLNTPTQIPRYNAPARTTAYSAQSDLPLAEKQLDRLVGMVQTLMQDNLELKRDMRGLKDNYELREHLVSLESTDARSTSGRGIAANRGRVTRANVSRNARKRQMTAHDSGDSDIDPALLDTVSDATTEGSETGITDSEAGNDVDFSPGERKALVRAPPTSFPQENSREVPVGGTWRCESVCAGHRVQRD
ncbi:hypothetical protein B0H13DRAFT_1850652 [Mycena leptocephala]|nr:hypothetical protein B0H13DRAFT_1850652 [Mycena leptocephala]